MFDVNTGDVLCNGVVLRRNETQEEFLATGAGAKAQLLAENKGWSTFRFGTDQNTFFVLQFKNGVLQQVRIALALDGDDSNPWAGKSEASRKLIHDKMLLDEFGEPPYQFDWGEIQSVNDMKSGASQIILNYR